MTKTVKVRILVAVDPDGKWSGYGCADTDEDIVRDCVFTDDMAQGESYHWITAEVPVPAPNEIPGEVEEA